MYAHPSALHAPEPRHLALGKLMDSYFKVLEHVVIRAPAYYILCYIFIFQTIINKVVSRYAALQEAPHLLYQAMLQPFAQPVGNLSATLITVYLHPHHQRANGRVLFQEWDVAGYTFLSL